MREQPSYTAQGLKRMRAAVEFLMRDQAGTRPMFGSRTDAILDDLAEFQKRELRLQTYISAGVGVTDVEAEADKEAEKICPPGMPTEYLWFKFWIKDGPPEFQPNHDRQSAYAWLEKRGKREPAPLPEGAIFYG